MTLHMPLVLLYHCPKKSSGLVIREVLREYLKDKKINWSKINDIEYYDGDSFGLGEALTFVKLNDKTIGYYNFEDESPDSEDDTIRNLYDKNKKKNR